MTIYKHGEAYIGKFKDNKRSGYGYGTYVYKDYQIEEQIITDLKTVPAYTIQATYEGEYLKDKRQGYGILITQENQTYEGSWLDDKRHG